MRSLLDFDDQREIDKLLEAKDAGLHKTLSGKFVKMGTAAARRDIEKRIEDLTHHRDESSSGTDSRMLYTGLLRILRKKHRANDRLMLAKNDKNKSSKRLVEESVDDVVGARVMHLAGIL